MMISAFQALMAIITAFALTPANPIVQTPAGSDPISLQRAQHYFQEMHAISDYDNGRLWGKPLYGPMLFVDAATRSIVANQADKQGILARRTLPNGGEVYVGTLPGEVIIANTAVEWAGVRWTMVQWPLPDRYVPRARLMAHECWHRIQEEIGLPPVDPVSPHLETLEGRYWLQLEWRALSKALLSEGQERAASLRDAVLFRSYRRSLFPNAADLERGLEMNEGVAEYTGVTLRGVTDEENRLEIAHELVTVPVETSFIRFFAYKSGPAYGLLLDALGANWRAGLKPTDELSDLALRAAGIQLPSDLADEARRQAAAYGGAAIRRSEVARDRKRRALIAAYRRRLVDGPVLLIPLINARFGFNPSNLVPMEGIGTVYPTMTVTGPWGKLEVQNGALMTSDFSKVYVAAPTEPNGSTLHGDGWTLTLNPGWHLAPGERNGDYSVVSDR